MSEKRSIDAYGDVKFQNKTKTLLLEPHFGMAKARPEGRTDPESPLRVFNQYSKWAVTIIDTEAEKKAVSHNLSINRHRYEFDDFLTSIQDGISMAVPYLYGMTASENKNAGPAYTTKLRLFPFKDQTPAEALLREGMPAREKLIDLYNKLAGNLAVYPNNKIQMDAIQDAVVLFDRNQLSEEMASARKITLYRSGNKPNPYKKEKGPGGQTVTVEDYENANVTELNVFLNLGDNYPIEIEIENYKAPCRKLGTGALNVVESQKRDSVKHSFRLSVQDARGMLREMDRQVNGFYYAHYAACEQDAIAEDRRRREEARNIAAPNVVEFGSVNQGYLFQQGNPYPSYNQPQYGQIPVQGYAEFGYTG